MSIFGSNYKSCDESIREEVRTALEQDKTRFGDIFKLLVEHGENYDKIAQELGLENTSGIRAYVNHINGIFRDFSTIRRAKRNKPVV